MYTVWLFQALYKEYCQNVTDKAYLCKFFTSLVVVNTISEKPNEFECPKLMVWSFESRSFIFRRNLELVMNTFLDKLVEFQTVHKVLFVMYYKSEESKLCQQFWIEDPLRLKLKYALNLRCEVDGEQGWIWRGGRNQDRPERVAKSAVFSCVWRSI